jgi:hypothetical protein
LEADLLMHLDFSLFVPELAYGKYSLQLQNYVCYLDVPPVLPTPAPAPACAVPTAAVYFARPPTAPTSVLLQPAPAAYYPHPCAPADWLGVPSPDNAHAKAHAFSDYYLAANSPLRFAPPRELAPGSGYLYSHPSQSGFFPPQPYASELRTEQELLQSMSPMVYPSAGSYSSGLVEHPLARSTSSGYFTQTQGTGRDSSDDSSATTCSTRTTSPYPSANNLAATLGGMYVHAGGAVGPSGALLRSQSVGGLNGMSVQQGGVYPSYGNLPWSGNDVGPKLCATPPPSQSGYRRGGLSIQTDLAMEYPLQRCESNGSAGTGTVTTPYSRYEVPAPVQRQTTYPGAQLGARSPYVAEDYRQHLYGAPGLSPLSQPPSLSGCAYTGHLGYASVYGSQQPSPCLYRQPSLAQQLEGDGGYASRRDYSSADATPVPGTRVVTPLATPGHCAVGPAAAYPSQLYPSSYTAVQGGQGFYAQPSAHLPTPPRGGGPSANAVGVRGEWAYAAAYPAYGHQQGHRYPHNGALLSAGAL